jgi:hypothetical protein
MAATGSRLHAPPTNVINRPNQAIRSADVPIEFAKAEPKWVVWSTRTSIENDIPSITAIIETLFAVLIYWWIAIQFETYLPFLVSVAIAPLVLLRSDESVELGVKWFAKWEHKVWQPNLRTLQPKKIKLALPILGSGVGLILLSDYILASTFLVGAAPHYAFFGGFVFGGVSMSLVLACWLLSPSDNSPARHENNRIPERVAITLITFLFLLVMNAAAGPMVAAGVILGTLLTSISLFVLVVSIAIRATATLKNLGAGIRSLPHNFRRLVLCTSPLQEPELVPGLQSFETDFTLSSVLLRYKVERQSTKFSDSLLAYFLYLPAIIMWFLPAWLYRITLKSTAWFWWPLAFLGGDLRRVKNPELFRWDVMGSLWAKTSIALALVTIVAFLFSNLVLTGVVIQQNPLLTPLGYFLMVDWSWGSWQILLVLVAALSLLIVFLVNDVGGKYDIAIKHADNKLLATAERRFGIIERILRVRLVLTLTSWLLVAAQALLYFNSSQCWFDLPSNVGSWANWAYGRKMPHRHCSANDEFG